VDGFLAAMEAGFLPRVQAWMKGSDDGLGSRTFKQKGDDLDIEVNGRKRFTQILSIGAGKQVAEDEDGAVIIEPFWEHTPDGYNLRMEVVATDGSRSRSVRQCLSADDNLLVQVHLKSGPRASWHYKRKFGGRVRPPDAKHHFPEPAKPSRSRSLEDGTPNFSGRWLCCRCEGEMEAFFVESGMPWAQRKLLQAAAWGVNVTERLITQADGRLEVIDKWPLGESKMAFRIDAGEQETTGLGGSGIWVTPFLEYGHVLRLVTQVKDRSSPPNFPIRYYLHGAQLAIAFQSPTGRFVTYFHDKC